MQSHPVMARLREGCEELKLPVTVASELARFLIVKRTAGSERREGLSPSSKVDDLQHWILLNTRVRDEVEELVGRIQHSTETAALPDALKVQRRLASMNLMAAEGWEPRIDLWEEPGTVMTGIQSVRLTHANETTTLYFCGDIGLPEIRARLAKTGYTCSPEDRNKIEDSHPLAPPRSRQRLSAADPLLRQEKVVITAVYRSGKELKFQCPRDLSIRTLQKQIARHGRLPQEDLRLMYYGRVLLSFETLDEVLEAKPKDPILIDVAMAQVGC